LRERIEEEKSSIIEIEQVRKSYMYLAASGPAMLEKERRKKS